MNCKTAPNVKELIEKYGVNNLVFVMDVDCFDEYGVAMGAMNGAGLIEPGQNTRRVAMVARERFHRLDENYKIELQGHDTDDLTIPFQTYHISSFEGLIRSGYVNIYVDTLDGFMPVFQCIDECFTPKEAKVIHQVQSNFFLRTIHQLMEAYAMDLGYITLHKVPTDNYKSSHFYPELDEGDLPDVVGLCSLDLAIPVSVYL